MADIAHPGYIAPSTGDWQFVAGIEFNGRFALAYAVPGYSVFGYSHRLYWQPYDREFPPQPGTAVLLETLPSDEWYGGLDITRLADGRLFLLTARTRDEVAGAPPLIVDRHSYLEYRLSRDEGATWSAPTVILSDYYAMQAGGIWLRPNGSLLISALRELNDVAPHVYDYYLAGNVDSSGAWTFDDSGETGIPTGDGEYPMATAEQFFGGKLNSIESTGRTQGISSGSYFSGSSPTFGSIYGGYATPRGNLYPFHGSEGVCLVPTLFGQAGRLYQSVTLFRWLASGAQYEWDSTTGSTSFDTGFESYNQGKVGKLHVDANGIVWMWYLTTANEIRLVSCRNFQAGRTTGNAFS